MILRELVGRAAAGGIDISGVPQGATGSSSELQHILNLAFMVAGAIAVLIIVIAGFRYIISQGDSSTVASSKNAIIYAAIGLAVVMFAAAIVNFVVKGVG